MLQHQPEFNAKCDVYSFAIVVWEMVTFKLPLMGDRTTTIKTKAEAIQAVVEQGLRPPRPTCASSPQAAAALYDLLQACWQPDPRKRPTFTEIIPQLAALQNVVHTQAFPWKLGERL
jgi:serine/threonine protein kinase